MLLHPVIGGMFAIPVRLLEGRTDLPRIRKELTADYHDISTGETRPVHMYRKTKNFLYVPREYAHANLPDLWDMALDRTVKPRIRPHSYPKEIKARDDKQQAFVDAIIERMQQAIFDNVIIDLQVTASTGTGKTVSFLKAVSDLQIAPALVMVHQNRIKEGWKGSVSLKKGMRFFFGEEWVEKYVGVVQQDECDWRGKRIVIAMGPSLISRRYEPEFYEAFGVICVDELHRFATPMLHECLEQFPAAIKIGMTATERKGRMRKVPRAHLGEPRIISKQKSMQPIVCRIKNVMNIGGTKKRFDNANSLRTILGRSKRRNELLTQVIYQRGFLNGRRCLVLSDRVAQLMTLRRKLVNECGVPEEAIGLYVGKYPTGKIKLTGCAISKSGRKKKHFRGLPGFKSPLAAKRYANKEAKRALGPGYQLLVKYAPELRQPTPEEYDHIENHSQIVLATFGIFSVAIDITDLDWGLEALPRGDVEQPVGRILRIKDGKKQPVWNTIEDYLIGVIDVEAFGVTKKMQYIFQTPKRLAKSRRGSYIRQNATFTKVRDPYGALQIQEA